jgi:hypothetical protein
MWVTTYTHVFSWWEIPCCEKWRVVASPAPLPNIFARIVGMPPADQDWAIWIQRWYASTKFQLNGWRSDVTHRQLHRILSCSHYKCLLQGWTVLLTGTTNSHIKHARVQSSQTVPYWTWERSKTIRPTKLYWSILLGQITFSRSTVRRKGSKLPRGVFTKKSTKLCGMPGADQNIPPAAAPSAAVWGLPMMQQYHMCCQTTTTSGVGDATLSCISSEILRPSHSLVAEKGAAAIVSHSTWGCDSIVLLFEAYRWCNSTICVIKRLLLVELEMPLYRA